MKSRVEYDKLLMAASRKSKEKKYWLEKLSGEIEKSIFLYDYSLKKDAGYTLGKVNQSLSLETQATLQKVTTGSDVRLHIILVAVLFALLNKYTGKNDLILAAPIMKVGDDSQQKKLFNTVLPIRCQIEPGTSFKQLILTVRQVILEATQNQGYPIEILLEELGFTYEQGDFPLFDVAAMVETIHDSSHLEHVTPNLVFSFSGLEKEMTGSLLYRQQFYKPSTAGRILHHFLVLLNNVISNMDVRLRDIDILSGDERERLLYQFNNTSTLYDGDKTVYQLFAEQVEKTPDQVAVVEPGDKPCSLSYQQLKRECERVAGRLIEEGLQPGDISAIMMERSLDMIIAILGILKAGAAYLPIDIDYPEERKQYILKDSNAKIIIGPIGPICQTGDRQESEGLDVIASRRAPTQPPATIPCKVSPTNLAYIIYTSGSTGQPKGVAVGHEGLVNLVYCHRDIFGEAPGERVSQVASAGFDAMGFEIWPCLCWGASLYIVKNETRLDPLAMKEWLIKNSITLSFQPTVIGEQLLDLDWSGQSVALRAIQAAGDRLTSWPQHEYPFSLYNLYGPTEDTVWTTIAEITAVPGEITGYPPIGKPIANHKVFILEPGPGPDLEIQPIGVAGELCIAGVGLAQGYLNNPELTAEKFIRTLRSNSLGRYAAHSQVITHLSSLLYRTGDLCRWLTDGNVEFLGRIDQQVKIRGFRIELGEIEKRLMEHEDVKAAVVIDREDEPGEKYLCAYIVVNNSSGLLHQTLLNKLNEHLSTQLPAYMVPTYIVVLEKIPLTANGKVNRRLLPQPQPADTGTPLIAPRDEIERKLAAIWAGILDKEQSQIGIDHSFFSLGGHSLKAAKMVAQVQDMFGKAIALPDVFVTPSIRALAERIRSAGDEGRTVDFIPSLEEKEYYPLSYNQKRMYILQQMAPGSSAYNMNGLVELDHEADEGIVRRVLEEIVARHDSLRTAIEFVKVDRVFCQVIKKEVDISFDTIDLKDRDLDPSQENAEISRLFSETAAMPFDLNKAPLFRARLVKTGNQRSAFMYHMHHIISDGWSMEILTDEFSRLYNALRQVPAEPLILSPLSLRYRDFAVWHNQQVTGPAGREAKGFWLEKFAGEVPLLSLPADTGRGASGTKGSAYLCTIGGKTQGRLKNVAATNQTTLFAVLFSGYLWFLSRICGQQDVACSIITSGREYPELHQVIGFFVNSVIFTAKVDKEQSFIDFLSQVSSDLIDTFRYQAYPLEPLFEELGRRYPDIPVSINMVNFDTVQGSQGQVPISEPQHVEDFQDVKFDLEVYIMEHIDGIFLQWVYRKQMFLPETIEYLVKKYIQILDHFAAKPDASLQDYLTAGTKGKIKRIKQEKKK